MSRAGCTADETIDRLRQLSQTRNTKLSVVAQSLVGEAVRRARARRTGADSPSSMRHAGRRVAVVLLVKARGTSAAACPSNRDAK